MYFEIQKICNFRKVLCYKLYICGLRQQAVIKHGTISVVRHINVNLI